MNCEQVAANTRQAASNLLATSSPGMRAPYATATTVGAGSLGPAGDIVERRMRHLPLAAAVRAEAAGDAAARSSLYLARVVRRPPRTYTVRLTALAVVNQSLPTDDFHRAEMC